MKKFKVGVCGNFDTEIKSINGQSQKTVNIAKQLILKYGENNVFCVDTSNFKKNPIVFLFNYLKMLKLCQNIVLLPANNSIRIVVPLAVRLKKKYRYKILYPVIGAWLANMLNAKTKLRECAKQIDMIYPESVTLKEELESIGIKNVKVMANFKNIEPFLYDEINKEFNKPYNICFFSRVTPQKGVDDLINAVKEINKNEIKYILDIYGPIYEPYKEEFLKCIEPPYINYKGVVEHDRGKYILKDYYLHIFPTKYPGDGVPGSVVESYMAGLPVIASCWPSCRDVIDDNITGLIYEFGNYKQLKEKLLEAYNEPEKMISMRENCIKKAYDYTPECVMKKLYDDMEV